MNSVESFEDQLEYMQTQASGFMDDCYSSHLKYEVVVPDVVNLFGRKWEQDQLDAFCKVLSLDLKPVNILSLSGCGLTDDDFSLVADAIGDRKIVQLDLSNNNFTGKIFETIRKTRLLGKISGVLDLREAFKMDGRSRNATLTERENLEFDIFHLKKFSPPAPHSSCAVIIDDETVYCNKPVRVTSFYMAGNNESREHSIIRLTTRKLLHRLQIQQEQLQTMTTQERVNYVLNHHSIREINILDFSNCRLSPYHADQIRSYLDNCVEKIQKLNFYNCGMTSKVFHLIAEAFSSLRFQLQEIDLRKNKLKNENIKDLFLIFKTTASFVDLRGAFKDDGRHENATELERRKIKNALPLFNENLCIILDNRTILSQSQATVITEYQAMTDGEGNYHHATYRKMLGDSNQKSELLPDYFEEDLLTKLSSESA